MGLQTVKELPASAPAGDGANAYTEMLARGFVHKLNNMLTVFHGYTSLLLADESLKKSTSDALKEIRKGANATSRLLGKLFAVAKLPKIESVVIDLADFCAGLPALLSKDLGENVRVEVSRHIEGRVLTGPTLLGRMLAALV